MSELSEYIEQTQERFESIAPQAMRFEAEKGFAIQLLNNNPTLAQSAKAHPVFIQQALTNVASIGLSLNPAKREAYLITRNVKVKNPNGRDEYQTRIFLEPSYMGLCNIATGTGRIEWIQAQIVRNEDEFEYGGVGEKPKHSFNAFKGRGDIIGVYAVAKTNQGDYLTDLMDMAQINSVMERSESIKYARKNNKAAFGPWVSDFEEMAKKTIVRRLFKMLPKTGMERMENAVNISNQNEGFEPIQTTPNIESFNEEQKQYFDSLIEKSDALGMYVFLMSIPESTHLSLYHSFPKGSKGKYQKVVDSLSANGRSLMEDMVLSIKEAIAKDDDLALSELVDGLSDDEIRLIEGNLDGEQEMLFNQMKTRLA